MQIYTFFRRQKLTPTAQGATILLMSRDKNTLIEFIIVIISHIRGQQCAYVKNKPEV